MGPLIELVHVRREFDGGRIVAVADVSLSVEHGESVAIIGPSGSGKSTVLNLLCGLDQPSGGEVRFEGKAVHGPRAWAEVRADHIGFVFQNFCLIPTLTAKENVEVAMLGRIAGAAKRAERAVSLLTSLGLGERLHLKPMKLSGGERQRVAIARALANEPRLIVADEPTGALDRKSAHAIMDILTGLQRDTRTALVIVTHDREVADTCGRKIEMVDGRIVNGPATGIVHAVAGGAR
ncbi:MAG: ABC transporter ATP-binding protein [Rhizobiales bacterium]|nr:ABC transporter ATP-binding protein [Hyphomicrobiales bacterium]